MGSGQCENANIKVERRIRTAAKVLVVVVFHRIHSPAVTFVRPFPRRSADSCLCPEAHVAPSAFHISELYVPSSHSQLCVWSRVIFCASKLQTETLRLRTVILGLRNKRSRFWLLKWKSSGSV
jgi:hypothetical protein